MNSQIYLKLPALRGRYTLSAATICLCLITISAFAQTIDSPKAAKKAKRGKAADAESQSKRIPQAFPDFDYTPNVVYKKVGDQALQLDILTPKGLKSEAAPVLVYIHGGGWGGGDRYRMVKGDIAGVFTRCGKAGIICVSIE